MSLATAPGKIILFGEHAVVYGQPALAVPVSTMRATAEISPAPSEIWIDAQDLGKRYRLEDAPATDPLATAVRLTFAHFQLPITDYQLLITIHSTIPPASGLGSGAAVCTAIVRALAQSLNLPISQSHIAALVFETEKLLHGTPSGIDNTVIAYEQPVYFIKGHAPVPFAAAQPLHYLIADTGVPSPTKIAVGDVRAAWQREPARYETLFAAMGALVSEARSLIETAHAIEARLGQLMNRNHALLQELGVSSVELETLVDAALGAGAWGAKLSGGGRGGNMLALVTAETEAAVRAALERAGARRVMKSVIGN